jgi:hypothetical protein
MADRSNSPSTIRQPVQVMPGQALDPQAPALHPVDRTYEILRQLESQKVQETANSLGSLTNVSDTADTGATDGQALLWVAADNEWEPGTITAGGTTTADLEANRPAGNEGDLFFPTDGFWVERKGASVWTPWGPVSRFVPPDPNNFFWVNQGAGPTAGVLTTANGGMTVRSNGKGTPHVRCQMMTAPATPYTVTAFVLASPVIESVAGAAAGLCFRDSVGGKLVTMHMESGKVQFGQLTSAAAGFAGLPYYAPEIYGAAHWWRMQDDGTDLIYWISVDGINWMQIFHKARHDFLAAGPDQVGFFADSEVSTAGLDFDTIFCTILSWEVT